MNKKENLVGDFYGLYHKIMKGYRVKEFELSTKNIKGILKWKLCFFNAKKNIRET